jgi:hypothetical protein
MKQELPDYVAAATPVPFSKWAAWFCNIAPAYFGVILKFVFWQYVTAFGPQVQRLRTECGTVRATMGLLKAPLDILADKLRGYIGLAMDLFERPGKVLEACEALMPHLYHAGLAGADIGDRNLVHQI